MSQNGRICEANLKVGKVLISQEQIQAKVKELADRISQDYRGKDILMVCILKGAFMFLGDLLKHLSLPVEIDFMATSSYGRRMKTTGRVRVTKELEVDIRERHVLVVEDIVDTGHTLKFILDYLASKKPASLKVCALLDKKERREVPINLDYVGFAIPNVFVVGYGLDYAERYRNLSYVASLVEED
ncbi:MAG: hypoxanthine phosphoribosyltransferase [Actinomycetota bacterium]